MEETDSLLRGPLLTSHFSKVTPWVEEGPRHSGNLVSLDEWPQEISKPLAMVVRTPGLSLLYSKAVAFLSSPPLSCHHKTYPLAEGKLPVI